MEELTVTEIDEIVIIEKMHAMCEESCSPDQFEEWEKLKAHLMVTRRNLRTAQQSVQADGRVLCACIPPLADTNSMGKCEACGCARR